MKQSKILFTLIFTFSLLSMSCNYTPLPDNQKDYVGAWYASDNTWVKIYLSGQGDFDLGGKTMNGGKTMISDGKITMSVMGINQVFTITKTPQQVKQEQWQMELDNIKYIRK